MNALLLSEEPDEDAILGLLLQRVGLNVATVGSLERGLRMWPDRPPDLILTALREPDPFVQVRRLRAETAAPLVIVVDTLEERERCELLESGADLVCPRPLAPRLLLAQLRALIRRVASSTNLATPPRLTVLHFTLDPAARTVQVLGQPPKRLTPLEFRLLYTLMIHRGQVLPTEMIVERVWGYGGEGGDSLVRRLVHRLRRKVEPDLRTPRYILTVPGVGYTFEIEEEEEEV